MQIFFTHKLETDAWNIGIIYIAYTKNTHNASK